jgi:putative nucleotidyltransferase with HDIG domain
MSINYSHLKRVKVLATDLKVGMYVGELDRDWSESNFLFQGFTINDKADIAEIQSQCSHVFVDFSSSEKYKDYLDGLKKNKKPGVQIKKREVHEEFADASKTFISSSKAVKTMLDQISLGEAFDLKSVTTTVSSCVYSILRNEDALMMLTQIRNSDEYTAEHCMRVGIMCIAFAKFLDHEEEFLHEIGICGMLHDVGKMKVPDAILNKPGRLTNEEMIVMRKHTTFGYEILLKKRHLTPSAIDVVLSHHERMDGNGYPRGLTREKISYHSKLISIVDTHDAITSKRIYMEARSPTFAYKILMEGRDSQFDAELVLKFIEWLGVYPAGSIVEMRNGQLGIVISVNRNKNLKLKPKVLLITDKNQKTIPAKIVDLSQMYLDEDNDFYKIKATHEDGYKGINLKEHLEKGLKIAF